MKARGDLRRLNSIVSISASRYRQIEQDEPFYESPQVTMERLLKLEHIMAIEVK